MKDTTLIILALAGVGIWYASTITSEVPESNLDPAEQDNVLNLVAGAIGARSAPGTGTLFGTAGTPIGAGTILGGHQTAYRGGQGTQLLESSMNGGGTAAGGYGRSYLA
jgi:hypothetical protein